MLSRLRSYLWTARAVGNLRKQLVQGHLREVTVIPPRFTPDPAAVHSALHRMNATCLIRSFVLQVAAGDEAPDIVIGVARHSDRIESHAWLEGSEDSTAWQEIMRIPP